MADHVKLPHVVLAKATQEGYRCEVQKLAFTHYNRDTIATVIPHDNPYMLYVFSTSGRMSELLYPDETTRDNAIDYLLNYRPIDVAKLVEDIVNKSAKYRKII